MSFESRGRGVVARAVWPLATICVLFAFEPARGADPPRLVAAWAAGPMEVRLAWDGPVDEAFAGRLVGRSITFAKPSRPGWDASKTPRGAIKIAAARRADGGRTLVLATDPHPTATSYLLRLDDAGGMPAEYSLGGVEASWGTGVEGDEPSWVEWWPSLDLQDWRALAARGSAEHAARLADLSKPGRLSIRTLLRLPKGTYAARLWSNVPVEASINGEDALKSSATPRGEYRVELAVESSGDVVDLLATLPTGLGGAPTALRATLATRAEPKAERALSDLLVPWSPTPAAPVVAPAAAPAFDLNGGDAARGEAVFFSEQARCAACHQVSGRGGAIGPDLSNQAGRDLASIYREINDPSAFIDPEYQPFVVAKKDGQVAVGLVRAAGSDGLRVVDTASQTTEVRRVDVAELRPSASSIMPAGLIGVLGEQKMRDLLAYLSRPPQSKSGGKR